MTDAPPPLIPARSWAIIDSTLREGEQFREISIVGGQPQVQIEAR